MSESNPKTVIKIVINIPAKIEASELVVALKRGLGFLKCQIERAGKRAGG